MTEYFSTQLKQVLRRLRRAPLFTFLTLLMLAAGVGANVAVFSVLEGVLLKPLPYPHPEQLVGVSLTAPGINLKDAQLSPADYFIYSEQNRSFENLGLWSPDSDTLTGIGEPEQVPALDITYGTLRTLGVKPALGRFFSPTDDVPSAPRTIILSYGYWQRKFGGSLSVIGRSIIVDGKARQIIGVLPQNFHFLDRPDAALLAPDQLDRSKLMLGQYSYNAIARLRPGVTIEKASADVARMLPIVMRSFSPPPGFSLDLFKQARIAPNLHPLKRNVVGDIGTLLWVLMGSLGMVLLIACANVANLFLVRTEGRQQELAIRTALGATRGRIAGDLFFESLVVGTIGSILGLGVAYGAIRFLVKLAPSGLPRLGEIGIDASVLLFTLAIAIFTSLLFGSVPVLKYAGATAGTGLREGGRTLSASRERHRARSALVTFQVALALVLLICSGLMIRSFRALTHVNPGFVPSDVQTFRIEIPSTDVKNDEQVPRVEQQMRDKIAALPGVTDVAFSNAVPMDGQQWQDPLHAQDRSDAQGEMPRLRQFNLVSPEYFATLRIPLVAGRSFTWSEIYNKIPEAVVSENLARDYWQTPANAIGKRIRISTVDDWAQIIGVAGDVHYNGITAEAPSYAYFPIMAAKFEIDPLRVERSPAFIVRASRAGSQALLNEIREAVWSVDRDIPLSNIQTLDYLYNKSVARTSFTLIMLGIAGGMAVLLGTVGLYGVIAYSVSQRTREIGIRMALGAQQNTLTLMFVRHGLLLTAIGIAFGLAAALAVMRFISSLLYGVSAFDPLTYISVTAVLLAIALLASYWPSRRAASVDPSVALRIE